jgi:uncharacterized membrane protein YgcG
VGRLVGGSGDQAKSDVVVALAANKADLAKNRRVSAAEAEAFAVECGGLLVHECSAKTGANVNDLFVAVARAIPKGAGVLVGGIKGKNGSTNIKVASKRDSSASADVGGGGSGGGCCG